MIELSLTIGIEPPTVNMYVRHTRSGRHYKTDAAETWDAETYFAASKAANCWTRDGSCNCREVVGKAHEVTYKVYQGAKKKGDVDNYAKCILDSLVKAGVLISDASVVAMHAYKFRDRENPRTEITVRSI